MKEKGEDLSRPNVFLKTRSMDKGADLHVLEVVEEMKRSIAHILEAEQTTIIKDKTFTDIMGHDSHGRVPTYGSGATSTDVFGASSSITSGSTLFDRIKQMVDSAVQARMIKYEVRREQEIDATITARMTEFDKCRDEETAASVKHYLEVLGIHIPLQLLPQDSPRMRSSVGSNYIYSIRGRIKKYRK